MPWKTAHRYSSGCNSEKILDIPIDDYWGEVIAEIELVDHIPTVAFDNISAFLHLEII